jgi:hypothetical protein
VQKQVICDAVMEKVDFKRFDVQMQIEAVVRKQACCGHREIRACSSSFACVNVKVRDLMCAKRVFLVWWVGCMLGWLVLLLAG